MKYPRIIVATIGLVLLVLGCSEAPTVSPDQQGTLNITLDDFKFTPDRIDLTAGRKVRMILDNKSTEHAHGFAIGYNLTREGVYPDGFENDLFEGVDVTVTGPAKLVNPGEAILTREGDTGAENGIGGNIKNGYGFMVLIEPSSEPTIIEFIVPKKFGEWEFTSFENDGERYEEGMRGVMRVFALEDNRSPWNKMPQDKAQPPTPTPTPK